MGAISSTFRTDETTGSIITASDYRLAIHTGKAFTVSNYAAGINSSDGIQWYIDTGAQECFLVFAISANAEVRATFHSSIAVTATNSGSVLTSYNLKRSSSNSASTVVYGSGTVTTSGAIMRELQIVSRRTTYGLPENEIILAADAQYMIKAAPLSGTANINLTMDLYELATA